jgi:hypothetical protein
MKDGGKEDTVVGQADTVAGQEDMGIKNAIKSFFT